jgi:hypothetical protein
MLTPRFPNGYIEGTSFPSRLIPRWTALVTLSAAANHTVIGHGELAHMIATGLFAFEVSIYTASCFPLP